jgi:hypothetical protein
MPVMELDLSNASIASLRCISGIFLSTLVELNKKKIKYNNTVNFLDINVDTQFFFTIIFEEM